MVATKQKVPNVSDNVPSHGQNSNVRKCAEIKARTSHLQSQTVILHVRLTPYLLKIVDVLAIIQPESTGDSALRLAEYGYTPLI